MKTLLVVHSSGRITRSITRHLAARFMAQWRIRHPDTALIEREVGVTPPPTVNEAWIAAAYGASPDAPAPDPLAWSETFINELFQADVIVLGAPIYNFGMPAQLKAWFDQIVRVGRTFSFDPEAAEPYQPLLAPKPVVILTSAGDGALHPGGKLSHLNHLEPHLQTLFGFIGLTDLTFIRAGYDEFQDDRTKRSLTTAEAAVDETVDRLCSEKAFNSSSTPRRD